MSVWDTKYHVKFDFINELCGNFPLEEKFYKEWYEKHWSEKVKPPQGKTIQEMQEEVFDAVMEAGEALSTIEDAKGIVGFVKRDGVLVVGGYTIRAHIKDCARVLSSYYVGKIKGEKSFASKIINCTYVEDLWIPICRTGGNPIADPDGLIEKPMTVTIPQTGQRMTTIKRFFHVAPASIEFTLLTLGNAVKQEDIQKCLEYGSLHGYLGERSVGKGRYTFTIKEVGDERKGKGRKAEKEHATA